MKVEPHKNRFVRVTDMNSAQTKWVRDEISAHHRFFENNTWFVREEQLPSLYQLGSDDRRSTTPGAPDDYEILHLRDDAPMAIVEAVWRALAKLHHPDVGGDAEAFKRALAAYKRIKVERD